MAVDVDTCTEMHAAPPRRPDPGGWRDGQQTGRGRRLSRGSRAPGHHGMEALSRGELETNTSRSS